MMAPTKAEHDAHVNARGRNYTDSSMRHAQPADTDNNEPGVIDRYITPKATR